MSFRRIALITGATAAALALSAGSAAAQPAPCVGAEQQITMANLDQARAAFLCLVNNERTTRGLRALQVNAALSRSAQDHANDMEARGFRGPEAPEPTPNGKTPRDRASKFGYPTTNSLGERAFGVGSTPRSNVAAAFASTEAFAPSNLCLPLIDRVYVDVGIGVTVEQGTGLPLFNYVLGGPGPPVSWNALCPITSLVTPVEPPAPAPPAPPAPPTPPAPPAPPAPPVTPKAAAQALAKQSPAAVATALGMPSAKVCVSRRAFDIRLRETKTIKLRSAKLTWSGRKSTAKRVKKRLTARVDLRGFKKGTFTVKITAKTTTGVTLKGTRKYKTCGAGGSKKAKL